MSKPQKPPPNPWNKKPPSRNGSSVSNRAPADEKFQHVRVKHQEAVKKHVLNYESSSDEEELQSDNVIESILKNYNKTGGKVEYLGRTSVFLQEAFQSGAAICLICISRVKREQSIWSCVECYCFFHLDCIQRWSKDSIVQQKQVLDNTVQSTIKKITWHCPKCRHDYNPDNIPTKYLCFCTKTENPKYELFLVPHSCGEICKKDLKPLCGHKCLLLCHPGPCPPCPVTINVGCYCGSQTPKTQRCSNKEWSCGNRCGKTLSCGKHVCSEACHAGDCKPCPKKSLQKCCCRSQQKLRDCATPIWKCERICNKPLDCGKHSCMEVCHQASECGPCVLTLPRTCPCGKSTFLLPCTEETPTCSDTCGKLLDCGQHTCNQRCHKDKCGLCLEVVEKLCRCGLHSKEVQCYKSYLCETKCKQMKDCHKHPCNRKCCDGFCPPCEKPCGRSLKCGNHKCNSVCHRGPCYPCNLTETVSCKCGRTKLIVPCGRKHKVKPPKCNQLCAIPPDCHHKQREPHKCHFGACPPCKQVCNKTHPVCGHACPAPCHASVMVTIEGEKATMPWEQIKPQTVFKALPCPDCTTLVSVTCFGEHETVDRPCFLARPSSCGRPCGRLLSCCNHHCQLQCHVVEGATSKTEAGGNCEECDNMCDKERPEGCTHPCALACHPGLCPPCTNMLRIKCHCGLTQPYVNCAQWLISEKREELQSCSNQCPKNYDCGHRCRSMCHSGPCPNSELCKKKVKLTCKCKRIKKDFTCDLVRKGQAVINCDEICKQKQDEELKLKQQIEEQKRKEEQIKNQKELEKYQKIFENKKKNKGRRIYQEEEEIGFFRKYLYLILAFSCCLFAIGVYFFIN